MKKVLPKIKKKVKSFILEEEAKISDKTVSKIAITSSFLLSGIVLNSEDANASGHSSHTRHGNENYADTIEDKVGKITGSEELTNTGEVEGTSIKGGFKIPAKSVMSVHGNHVRHKSGGGC